MIDLHHLPHWYLDSMVPHFNEVVTDTAAELLANSRKRKPSVTPTIVDFCDKRRDLKERGELGGAKYYRKIKRKIRTGMKVAKETLIERKFQEVEACIRKK